MLESILAYIEQAPPWLVFASIFLASYIENLFPPLPGDTILVFSAYLVGRGNLPFGPALATTIVASIGGFMTMYVLGRSLGRGFILSQQQTWFSENSLERIESLFARWGYGVILVNRFLAGLRTVVAFFAGMGRLSAVKVFVLALISVVLWNGGLLWAGAAIGENWEIIGHYLKQYNRIISITLAVIIVGFILHRYVIVKRNLESRRET